LKIDVHPPPAELASSEPRPVPELRVARTADRVGAVVGFLCAIHCALVPILLGLVPAIGLGFLVDETFERVLLIVAAFVAGVAFLHAWRRRHPLSIILGFAGGLALLVLGHGFEEYTVPSAFLSVSGGVLLGVSHIRNSRCHRAACAH